jgi:hypothetical protein
MSPKHSEARREPRRPASGSVRVTFQNPMDTIVEGHLLDLSNSGFRMGHTSTSLAPGQMVQFTHSAASGSARVIWNRVMDDRVETGFLILA